MSDTSTVPATAATLEVPGARLHYEVRGQGSPIVLIGAPMGASSFAPLADRLATDHLVLTTDPRGVGRSPVADPDQDSTAELRADDLSRLLAHLDAGPAAVLGSSGGAVSALALVQAHPEQVHTVIAHEPPFNALLEDPEARHAAVEDLIAIYRSGDRVGAWRRFLANANITLPEPVFEEMFGRDPDPQTAADERHWFEHEMRPTTRWEPDLAALRAATTRIVAGIGEESVGQHCDRVTTALAAALDIKPTSFPGGHTGFVDDPDQFATRLREVLRER